MRRLPYRRTPLLACAVAVLLATAASCGPERSASDTTATTASTLTTATLAPLTTSTTTTSSTSDQRTIRVTALGQAEGTPGALVLMLGVEVFGTSTAEALSTLAAKATTLTAFLRQYGIDGADVQTTGLWAYPMYGDYSGDMPAVSGYQAGETFSVKVDDLTAAAPLLDGATFAIADALRLQGLTWVVDDSEARQQRARLDAIDRARRQAKQLATAAGLTLGPILSIDEANGNALSGYYGGAGMEAMPIAPGSLTVSTQVTITFSAA